VKSPDKGFRKILISKGAKTYWLFYPGFSGESESNLSKKLLEINIVKKLEVTDP
jgi:hypothetical protein